MHGVAQVKHRLKQALRSDLSNDSYKSGRGDKPDSPDPRVTRGFGWQRSTLTRTVLVLRIQPSEAEQPSTGAACQKRALDSRTCVQG